jgi:uncharacterized lipoprotein NlpE involved in copper resistance
MKKLVAVLLAGVFILSSAGCGNKKDANPINPSQTTFTVLISSTPDSADAYVNDEYEGITPCKINVKNGTYKFTVLKDGYLAKTKNIKITENTKLSFMLPKPEVKGTLNNVPFWNFRTGIPYNNLYIFTTGKDIECVSLNDLKILWKKNFDNAFNFILSNGTMYVEKQDESDNTVNEEIFTVDPQTGNIIAKEQFTLKKFKKYYTISFGGVSEGIAVFKEFLGGYGPPPYGLRLKAYSLKAHKLLYSKSFSAFVTEIPIFGKYLYLFGGYKSGITAYKINKFTGEIVSQANFFTLFSVNYFSATTLPAEGEKVALHFSANKTFTYIIDLKKQAILFKLKGNFIIQNNRYLLTADDTNIEKNLTVNVIDLSSMKRIGVVSYNLPYDDKKIPYPFVSFPAYDSANHRIYFFVNGALHCFNEKGIEIEISFNKGYKYLIKPSPVYLYRIYINSKKGIIAFVNRSAPHKVLVTDSKTLTPLFISQDDGYIYKDNLFLYRVTKKGDSTKNIPDKGTVTVIDLSQFER